jgi:hypothetical protein
MGKAKVVEQAGATGTDIDVAIVYDAANNSKERALLALQTIEEYITTDTWPPI